MGQLSAGIEEVRVDRHDSMGSHLLQWLQRADAVARQRDGQPVFVLPILNLEIVNAHRAVHGERPRLHIEKIFAQLGLGFGADEHARSDDDVLTRTQTTKFSASTAVACAV
jgi:hypothetical protein